MKFYLREKFSHDFQEISGNLSKWRPEKTNHQVIIYADKRYSNKKLPYFISNIFPRTFFFLWHQKHFFFFLRDVKLIK